jgi:hypothetical protein
MAFLLTLPIWCGPGCVKPLATGSKSIPIASSRPEGV